MKLPSVGEQVKVLASGQVEFFAPRPGGHCRVLCTLQRAVWLFHEDKTLTRPADFGLGTLCEYFGVRLRPEEAHDALAEVRATVELFRAMLTHSRQSVGTVRCPASQDQVSVAAKFRRHNRAAWVASMPGASASCRRGFRRHGLRCSMARGRGHPLAWPE